MVTLSGTTSAAAYVYCGVSKNPASRLRALQNATASNASNATATPTKPVETVSIRAANAAS